MGSITTEQMVAAIESLAKQTNAAISAIRQRVTSLEHGSNSGGSGGSSAPAESGKRAEQDAAYVNLTAEIAEVLDKLKAGTAEVSGGLKAGTAEISGGLKAGSLAVSGAAELGGGATFGTETIGGTAKPIYLKEGALTACSGTVGGTSRPVYLKSGTFTAITALGIAYGGTGATTAVEALSNLGITYGTWTPTIYGATVSSYSRQYGYYIKIGNHVIVSWYLYGTFSSGQTGTAFRISGCPYAPEYRASGGGSCSGYYAGANAVFSGWTLNASNIIGAEGQAVSSSAGTHYSQTIYCGTSDFAASGTIAFATA